MSAIELKPCPFCGGAARLDNYLEEAGVECLICRATILRPHGEFCDGSGIERAASAWNARAALTPPEGYVLVEAAKAADSERLDFLDAMNVALNCHYGTNYGWRLILSDRISRLMSGRQWQGKVGDVDLNDQNAGSSGFSGCREAIDAARPEVP